MGRVMRPGEVEGSGRQVKVSAGWREGGGAFCMVNSTVAKMSCSADGLFSRCTGAVVWLCVGCQES